MRSRKLMAKASRAPGGARIPRNMYVFGIPEISKVGVELDRKLAALLEALHVDVP